MSWGEGSFQVNQTYYSAVCPVHGVSNFSKVSDKCNRCQGKRESGTFTDPEYTRKRRDAEERQIKTEKEYWEL